MLYRVSKIKNIQPVTRHILAVYIFAFLSSSKAPHNIKIATDAMIKLGKMVIQWNDIININP